MLALFFQVGGERYALRCADLIEVVPQVALRRLPHAPPAVLGIFNYRGTVTPVIDLCRLMTGTACPDRLSSRIMLASYRVGGGARPLGLLAEAISEAARLEQEAGGSGVAVPDAPYLGEIWFHERRMVQLVRVDQVLPPALRDLLFAEEAGAT